MVATIIFATAAAISDTPLKMFQTVGIILGLCIIGVIGWIIIKIFVE